MSSPFFIHFACCLADRLYCLSGSGLILAKVLFLARGKLQPVYLNTIGNRVPVYITRRAIDPPGSAIQTDLQAATQIDLPDCIDVCLGPPWKDTD